MKTPGRKLWAVALAFLLGTGSGLLVLAQQQEPPTEQKQGPIQPKPEEDKTPYALRVEVPLVDVDVTVVDTKSGTLISGLKKEHFRVYMDGVEQEVAAFAPVETPITTVLLVEATPLVGYVRYDNLDAAYLFLRQMRKGDWVALVSYDIRPRIEVDFTHDPEAILQGLRQMVYGGMSEANMYDAVIDTLDRLKDVEGKKSIILIGTGLDTFSRNGWDDARRAARENGATIFALGMAWPITLLLEQREAMTGRSGALLRMDIALAEAQLRDLAEQTGGRAYFPRFITELPGIYGDIGAMLRNQYTLAFRPKPFKKDGKFHKIEVKLVAPDGKPLKVINQDQKEIKVEVYARKGYYAPES